MLIRKTKPFNVGFAEISVSGNNDPESIGFGILSLAKGSPYTDERLRERGFMLISGRVRFNWANGVFEAERHSMLDTAPSSLHVGVGSTIMISTLSDFVELAVFDVPNPNPLPVLAIPPIDVRISAVSPVKLDHTADREIRTVLDDSNAPHSAMTFGEVVNHPGRWSSYPPHHHSQKELYHFRFFPSGGFGYSGQGEEVYKVKDGDTVLIPSGLTHPQVAAPGYTMVYLWCIRHLAGDRFGADSRKYPTEFAWTL